MVMRCVHEHRVLREGVLSFGTEEAEREWFRMERQAEIVAKMRMEQEEFARLQDAEVRGGRWQLMLKCLRCMQRALSRAAMGGRAEERCI